MSQRRQAREIAVQVLYALDISSGLASADDALTRYLSLIVSSEEDDRLDFGIEGEIIAVVEDFARRLIVGTWQNLSTIDALIASHTEHWDLDRLMKTDKAVLRLACFELFFCDDIPRNVSINEAIELAKCYGEENSPAFVNGVLDGIAAKIVAE